MGSEGQSSGRFCNTNPGVITVAPHSERPHGAAQGWTCYTFCSLCGPVRWGPFMPTLQM